MVNLIELGFAATRDTRESLKLADSVIVSLMHNNTKNVETWVDNTLRVSLVSLAFLVKLERERERREVAKVRKDKNPPVGDHVV